MILIAYFTANTGQLDSEPYHFSVTILTLKAENTVDTYLYVYPVYLFVLGINLIAHIQSHIFQIPKNVSYLSKIFIHFVFSGIICYPVQILKSVSMNQELALLYPKIILL